MRKKIKTSIFMTSIAILILHIINYCIRTAAVAKNLLFKNTGHIFEWRFGKVFYFKTGSGSPVLLLHDLTPCSSSVEWQDIIDKLSKDHTVYCIDLPGCGRSDKSNITYTNFLYVQFLSDFVNNIIGKPTDIIATGFSSSFALTACNYNPDLFGKIIMVNPEQISKFCTVPETYSKIINLFINLPIIGTFIYHIYVSRENIEYNFTENYFYNPFLVKKKLLHSYYEAAHTQESKGKYLLSSLHGGYMNVDIRRALKNTDKQLYIMSSKKIAENRALVNEYLQYNDTIQILWMDDVKKYPQLENPELFLLTLTSVI